MRTSEQEQQFADWTRDHGAVIHHVVNGFAEGDDRNDLLQEILLAIWKSIPAFRGQARPATYLYRVCHNAAMGWIRTRRNYRLRLERYGAEEARTGAPESDVLEEERLAALYAAIRELKPADRSLILLSLDGLSYRDMAEVLGISESNVGVKLNRIKTQLTTTLKEKHHELR